MKLVFIRYVINRPVLCISFYWNLDISGIHSKDEICGFLLMLIIIFVVLMKFFNQHTKIRTKGKNQVS